MAWATPTAAAAAARASPLTLAWPGWPHVRHYLGLWALVTLEFIVVFFGGDFLTAHRVVHWQVFLPSELAIPLIPAMVIVYLSIYLIWIPAPFLLRERSQLNRLGLALALVIFMAAVGFVTVPAELGFPPVAEDLARLDPAAAHRWGPWLRLADFLNLDYDLIPSLHVALFVTTAGAYARHARPIGRFVLIVWSAAVIASTVLTHQHHVIDAVAGLVLGLGGAHLAATTTTCTIARQH